MSISALPHALIYAGYFATLAVLLTFLPAYLGRLDFSGAEIGLVLSFSPVMVLVTPLLLGYLSDRLRRELLILRLTIGGALLAFSALLFVERFATVAAVLLLYAMFAAPIASLTDAATLEVVDRTEGDYARVRLFGSAGFVLASFGVGALTTRYADRGAAVLLVGVATLSLALFASFGVRSAGVRRAPALWTDFAGLLADRRLRLFLLCGALHWIALAPYHAFFALHVQALGLEPTVAGAGFGVGALAEVLVLAIYRRALGGADPVALLSLAFAGSCVRWLLTAWVTDPVALVAVQTLHGLSFGVFYVACLDVLRDVVPSHVRATGQGLFFSAVFGIGGGVGTLAAGAGFDALSGSTLFVVASVISGLSAVLVLGLRSMGAAAGAQ